MLLTVFCEGDDLEDLAETCEYLQQKWKYEISEIFS